MPEYSLSSERVAIAAGNESAYISTKFSNMKTGMIGRELTMNVVEATDENTIAFIEPVIDGFVAPKLAFFNTVKEGFFANELVNVTDVAWTSKLLEADGGTNHGEGGKYAVMRFNQYGVIWTSRKNGVITRVKCFMSEGFFERETYLSPGNIQSYLILGREDLSPEDIRRYYERIPEDVDFFDVKLLGMREDHNTFTNPYDEANPEKDVILREIVNRFSQFQTQ